MRARRRDDRGVASIELIGMLPLVLVTALIVTQVAAFMWAATATNDAVRQGARAQSQNQDGCVAARAVLPDSLDIVRCTRYGGSELGDNPALRLVVDIPILPAVAYFAPDLDVTRTAYLP